MWFFKNISLNTYNNLVTFRSGNVSRGAQEVFHELPHEYVPPEMLQKVAEHGGKNLIHIYCRHIIKSVSITLVA